MHPQKVGRYELIETLGGGGMGIVYKARDPLIDRVVAVKTLGFGLSPHEAADFRKRFAREAKSAGRLNHPNIVTIHDMGESDDGAYIAMEFLEGRSLRQILDTGVVLPPSTVAKIAMQVALGLGFAHQHEVVHCDIKPGNIVVLENGTVKITDFGIARLPTGSRTFAGNVLGSPRYISPEQIVGHPVDARSDLFSLGAVLYEMLTGVPPFAGTAIDEILYQVINDKPDPPSSRNRSLPAAYDEIVARAMAKDREDRYQTAHQMAAALRPLARDHDAVKLSLPPIGTRRTREVAGVDTVTIDPEEMLDAGGDGVGRLSGDAGGSVSQRRRRVVMYALPAALLVLGIWTLVTLQVPDEGPPIPQVAASQGTAAAPAPSSQLLQQPAPPPFADKANRGGIPPLELRPAAQPMAEPDARAPRAGSVETRDAAKATAPPAPPRSEARLAIAVAPWGEVYVDGRKRGVSPPLTELKLPPGTYRIEIRNTTFPPYGATVELAADGSARIRHRFGQ